MARKTSALVAPLIVLSLLGSVGALSGCGGGGGGSDHDVVANPTGQVRVNVTWPLAHSREIPTNARSIKIEVWDNTLMALSTVIVSPATTALLEDVPCGAMTIHAAAYASVDGTGVPLATADRPVLVADGSTATVSLTMASTIDHLEYAPNPFVVGVGTNQPLVVTAKDGAGGTVLLDPGALTYSSSNPSLLTISSTGTVTGGLGMGLGTITVNEANSHKSLTFGAQVALGIAITPPVAVLNVDKTATFVATVLGATNAGVTWTVREANGGTITPSGVYTAPHHRGIFHIDATSVADPARTASASISVTAGSINAEVH